MCRTPPEASRLEILGRSVRERLAATMFIVGPLDIAVGDADGNHGHRWMALGLARSADRLADIGEVTCAWVELVVRAVLIAVRALPNQVIDAPSIDGRVRVRRHGDDKA